MAVQLHGLRARGSTRRREGVDGWGMGGGGGGGGGNWLINMDFSLKITLRWAWDITKVPLEDEMRVTFAAPASNEKKKPLLTST